MTAGFPGSRDRPLVIGIGNRFRRDDGVAAAVLDELSALPEPFAADLLELDGEPTRIVDAWAGRPAVVVVDAVVDPGREPGDVVTMGACDAIALAGWQTPVSGHSGGLAEAMGLGAVLDRMPERLSFVGVVGCDFDDGPGLSAPAHGALGAATDAVRAAVTGSSDARAGSRVPR